MSPWGSWGDDPHWVPCKSVPNNRPSIPLPERAVRSTYHHQVGDQELAHGDQCPRVQSPWVKNSAFQGQLRSPPWSWKMPYAAISDSAGYGDPSWNDMWTANHNDRNLAEFKSSLLILGSWIGIKGWVRFALKRDFLLTTKKMFLRGKGKGKKRLCQKKKIKGYFLGSIKRNFAGSNSWKTWSEEEASDLKWSGQERREAVGPQYCT